MLERLFSSRIRVQLLARLLLNPGQSYHIRQLERLLDGSYTNIRRELQNLADLGVLNVNTIANTRHYQANESHLLYHELRSILLKTEGLGDALRAELERVSNVRLAFVYGSLAAGRERVDSDVDLLIVGDPDVQEMERVLDASEARLGRPINYALYKPGEWSQRLAEHDAFLMRVLAGPRIILIEERSGPEGNAATGAH